MLVSLSDQMIEVLRPILSGRRGVDLGAGIHAKAAIQLISATDVEAILAIDSKRFHLRATSKLTLLSAPFARIGRDAVETHPDFALVFWPDIRPRWPSLIRILDLYDSIIYCGHNFDGTACGSPDLFDYFLGRDLVGYVPDRANSLIVLGGRLESPRDPTPEERAGMDHERIHAFPASDHRGMMAGRDG